MIWKELNDNLVFHNLKASDNIEVLQLMGDAMIQEGYGEEGFTEASTCDFDLRRVRKSIHKVKRMTGE